jgi:ribose-phosphate pyrophosphokinase
MLVLGFADYRQAGQRLADELAVPYAEVDVHRFPDGEHKLTLPTPLPAEVVVCRSLFEPNEKLIDLLLLSATARDLGARRLVLVAPYLCYMRQDKVFHPGEAVSQRIIGRLLADCFDALITVDPHMHRTPNLSDAVPAKHAVTLSAAVPIAEFLEAMPGKPLLVGPDGESRQWVQAIARLAGLDYIVASKHRSGDRSIGIKLPDTTLAGRETVLIDDIVSTGCTLARAAEALFARDAMTVRCIATHVLPNGGAERELGKAGVSELLSTDSIPHSSNRILLAALLASAVRALDGAN